jgi:hypothetical protein
VLLPVAMMAMMMMMMMMMMTYHRVAVSVDRSVHPSAHPFTCLLAAFIALSACLAGAEAAARLAMVERTEAGAASLREKLAATERALRMAEEQVRALSIPAPIKLSTD